MFYKILEKYSQLKSNNQANQLKENNIISEYDKSIIQNFLNLYDKDVKKIHSNQELIERNLQILYAESNSFVSISKEAFKCYDNLIEYFKEAGDLYNFCTILAKEMNDIQTQFSLQRAQINPKDKK